MPDVQVERDQIIVSWLGEVHTRPDAMEVTLRIDASGESTEEALAENAEQVERLLGNLARAGVAHGQVSVAGPTVAGYAPPFAENNPDTPFGVVVRTYVRIERSFPPDQAAQAVQELAVMLDAATKAKARLGEHGADPLSFSLHGGGEVMFLLKDSSSARTQAIAKGIRATQPLAEAAACAAGGALGPVIGVHVATPSTEQLQRATRLHLLPVDLNQVRSPIVNELVVRVAVTVAYQCEW